MARIEAPGFCDEPCDIDDYQKSVDQLTTRVAVDRALDDNTKRTDAAEAIGKFQQGLLDGARLDAIEFPCAGRLAVGMAIVSSPDKIHCPLMQMQLINLGI